MTQPRKPEDHPAPEETSKQSNPDPTGAAPNGVPPEATADDAAGTPDNDRAESETAASPDKQGG